MLQLRVIIYLVLVSVLLYSCRPEGCTDYKALNYDADALKDDGSCIARIYGCMDSLSVNYNPAANTDNDSCVYLGSAVFYSTSAASVDLFLWSGISTETINPGLITEVYCGAPGCATFLDIPTQPGGLFYNYSAYVNGNFIDGQIGVFPNTCSERVITP